ncbi:DUF4245 family protein [Nocardioides pantholopis]|uniref:DUF4245 family protein n=1 Tax=Nocardioides pantholopis TaxID=2483798 RepID=UPI000F07DD02|nr:DUF4245 family protein [Nocardioides pantholopis]
MSDQGTGGSAPAGGAGRPGRYQTSIRGLIGAMVVLLLAVAGFVVFREVTRDNPEFEVEPVEYLGAVADQQRAGRTVVYPASLPKGWVVTSITYTPGDRPGWGMGILTDDGTFAGLRQQEESLVQLLDVYVDEETTETEPITVTGSVAPRWEGYADEGGDHAYAAELGEETVLVFGSASQADLEELIEELTTAPVR